MLGLDEEDVYRPSVYVCGWKAISKASRRGGVMINSHWRGMKHER